MRKILFWAVASIFIAGAARAASIDIDGALDIALQENADLRSQRQELVKAEAAKIEADGVWLPYVSAEGYVDRQREPQTNDGSDRSDSRSVTATLEQTIYSGGKNTALREQAKQTRTIADLAIADLENSVAGELYARFYNVLLKKKEIEAEEAAVSTSSAHLDEVRKQVSLGLANRLELIRAGQQLASDRADLATAKGGFDTAVISLMNYMNIPPEERLEVRGELYEPKPGGDRRSSLEAAQRFRADRKQLEEQIGYQKSQIKITRSAMNPTVTAGLSAGWSNPYSNEGRGDESWRASVTVSVPIFDRNATRSAVISAKAVLEQDKIALEQKELDVKSEVETAWAEIESSESALRASEEALALAKETLRLAEVGYREGVTPQLDLLSAQSSLTEAQHDYNSAQYTYLIAVVALKVTEGDIVGWNGGR